MKFKIVSESQRSGFPVLFFNDPIFDIKVFNIADRMLNNYNGGYWEYVTTDRAAFLRLSGEEYQVQVITNPFSGEDFTMDATAAGMILTSYALMRELEKGKDLHDLHYNLNQALQDYLEEIDRWDIWMGIMD